MGVKLQSSSGGSVEIAAPVTASNYTLTAPAKTGNIITSADSATVTAAMLAAGAARANFGAGAVLQVVNATFSSATTSTSTTFSDTGLTATITPTSATSKVLVLVNQAGCGKATNDTSLGLRLLRNSTPLLMFEGAGAWTGSVQSNIIGTCAASYLDSPSTTSAVTYKTQMNSFNGGAYAYTQYNVGQGNGASTITLMEIAG